MLSTLAAAPVSLLSLGVRQHGVLLQGQVEAARHCLEASDWTCHICGVRVPEMMEIDHTAGHSRTAQKGYRTICQFCHNLKHPLWAGARGRIVPIIAPGIGQIDLHRLAWALLAQRDSKTPAVDVSGALEDIEYRRQLFIEVYKADRVDAFLEAILDLPRVLGPKRAEATVMAVDAQVRFWPAELLKAGTEPASPASRLSTWREGGFRKAAKTAANLINTAFPIDGSELRTLLTSIPDLEIREPEVLQDEPELEEDQPAEEETDHDDSSDLFKDFPLD